MSYKILNCRIDSFTENEVLDKVISFLHSNKPHQIITVNSLMIWNSLNDTLLQKVFEDADLVVPDSIGIIIAARLLGFKLKDRIPGIDLIKKICSILNKKKLSVFLLGAKPGVCEKVADSLKNLFPDLKISGIHNGYFSDTDEVISKINDGNPDVLFVGLSTSYQEKWIYNNLKRLNVKIVMGVGGSFDVISGNLIRAPLFIRKIGLEWIWRFILQPWRIKRIIFLPAFLILVLFQKLKIKK